MHNGSFERRIFPEAKLAIANKFAKKPAAKTDLQFRYDADLQPANGSRKDMPGDRKVDVRVEIDHPTDPRLNYMTCRLD